MITEGEVAQFLIDRQYFLTALELHQELVEDPNRNPPLLLQRLFSRLPENKELEDLSAYFSSKKGVGIEQIQERNAEENGDVTSESPIQRDTSIDFDLELKNKEEQVQILEFELKQARETIDSLRNRLTLISGANTTAEDIEEQKEAEKLARDLEVAEDIKVHEKRTLNYLLKNYLSSMGYKLTSITFSDEVNDQNVDNWDDVGLNCSAPPSLLSFYRYFYNAGPNQFLNKIEEESRIAKKKAAKWKGRAKKVPALEAELHELKMSIKFEKDRVLSAPIIEKPKEKDKVQTEETKTKPTDEKRKIRLSPLQLPEIRKIAWLEENSQIVTRIENVSKLGKQQNGAVQIVAENLPDIIPSVLLKARKDLLPILLITIQQHPDTKIRDKLTNLLFNLIKKPDEQKRQMIITGCVALAKLIGKERTEGELLPQCWEQIASKYEERRVLVAESCGALAAYTKSSMRVSLIMSIIMQLLDDKSELVREAVAKNLAQLISFFEDDEKYFKVEELLLRLFYDSSREVVDCVRNILVPVFMEWSNSLGHLFSRFVPLFVSEMGKLLKNMDPGRINEQDASRVEMLFDIILLVIPHIYENIISSSPTLDISSVIHSTKQPIITASPIVQKANHDKDDDDELFTSSFGFKDPSIVLLPQQIEALRDLFNQFISTSSEDSMWKELLWFKNEFFNDLISIVCKSHALESPRIANGMAVIISKICTTFGPAFTQNFVEKPFRDILFKDNMSLSPKELQNSRVRLTPVYLLGVLTSFGDAELTQFVKEITVSIAQKENGWNHDHFMMLTDSIRLLCTSANKTDQIAKLLMQDLVSSPAAEVRAVLVRIYEDLMTFLSSTDIEEKLLPALANFSNDAATPVRIATIKQLCNVALITNQKQLLDKIDAQIDAMISKNDHLHEIVCEVIREFTRITPSVVGSFRESCILPKLIKIIDKNNHNKNSDQRNEGCKLVVEAYRAFNGCVITHETIQMYILPGLRLVQANSNTMDSSLKTTVTRMVTDLERAVGNAIGGGSQPSTPTKQQEDEKKKRAWGLKWGGAAQ